MSVPHIASHASGHSPTQSRPLPLMRELSPRWEIGQAVSVKVQQPLHPPFYLAQIAGGPSQFVESAVALSAGANVRAVVVAVGARLELKLVDGTHDASIVVSGSDPGAAGLSELEASAPLVASAMAPGSSDSIAAQVRTLSAQYRLTLGERDQAQLITAVSRAKEQPAMLLAGLYLASIDVPLTRNALEALYLAQTRQPLRRLASDAATALNLTALTGASAAPAQAALEAVVGRMDRVINGEATGQLTQMSVAAPEVATAGAPSDSGAPGDRWSDASGDHVAELAMQLLNVSDRPAVARHFGTFPVLVSGQLLELQFVAIRHDDARCEQPASRRLLMALTTPSLGRIQVSAQAQGKRLILQIAGHSTRATEILAQHAGEVRELAMRLGWQVDSVLYRVDPQPGGAASEAMELALREGDMDQLL
ncbi:MAG TPA: flagellar hook-length control protein FliK [Steroidobacteraceae bacterium]|jgi:hypothetical protein|nr:flagellar hook-length control protein FliK [Steroidobacteraceae bacterium]